MRRIFLVLFLLVAAFGPHDALAARPGGKAPIMTVKSTQTPSTASVGDAIKVRITIEPPKGIELNRYPGITLKLDDVTDFETATQEVFVGTRELPEDIEKNGFKVVPPLEFFVTAKKGGRGKKALSATLKYFYCVKSSGYCAPGSQSVHIPLTVR